MTNPKRVVPALVPLVLLAVACQEVEPARSSASGGIVNGTPTTGSPATVYLELGGDGSCSGTLISPKVVLTAAHCLEGVTAASVRAFFGSNVQAAGTWIPAVNALAHTSGDIAVVALRDPGPATPVPPFAGNLATHLNQPVHIVGFGVTSETGSDSGIKREGRATLVSANGDSMHTSTSMAGTCYGDSGGPSYMTIAGTTYVAGVTSTGTADCGSGEDVNTRTDTYIAWIRAYVMQHDPDAGGGGTGGGACASDGTCNPACPDHVTADSDCAGCGGGGACRTDCPALDADCCAADGACHQACGATDVDCAEPPADPGSPGTGGGDGEDDAEHGGEASGGCSAGGPGAPAVLVIMVLGVVARPRRRGAGHRQ